MSELKRGDIVYVSDVSEKHAVKNKSESEFICKYRDKYICANEFGNVFSWSYVVKYNECDYDRGYRQGRIDACNEMKDLLIKTKGLK